MNSLRSIVNKGKETTFKMKDPVKRFQMRHETRNNFLTYRLVRRLFIITGFSLIIQVMYNWKINFYGTVSRISGKLADIKMPRALILPILSMYWRFYEVNIDEIEGNDIGQFNSISSFFTRKLKDGWRTIEDKDNPYTLTSPCDGTVYNFGDCEDDTMVVVKGTPYKLEHFLFGKAEKDENNFKKILDRINERGNILKFVLIYLSPADYHRFHSPAICSTNYRRHIAGNFHLVKPSYVNRHPRTFVCNERVSLFGEWSEGFFTQTFIGATNVGSIIINFDKELRTNIPGVKFSEVFDKNYLQVTEFEGVFKNNLITKKKFLKKLDEDKVDISSDLNTFDVRDIIDTDKGETSFVYKQHEEHKFPYRLENQFREEESKPNESEYDSYQEKLSKKLENSADYLQKYSITNKGVMLNKGQEVGYFNLGSSIMLIFEASKDSEFIIEVGQKLKLGNTIFKSHK